MDLWPVAPEYAASDSHNTVRSVLGLERLRKHRLQQWAAGVVPTMDYFSRPLGTFAIPRSVKAAADFGAGMAVQLVRDMSVASGRQCRARPRLLPRVAQERLLCELQTDNRLDLVVFKRPLAALSVQELERTGWRALLVGALGMDGVSVVPFSGSLHDTLHTLEWTACMPAVSHVGLFLACTVYLCRSPPNHRGHRLVRAYASSMRHAAAHSCVSGWVFTWYLASSDVHGRVLDRTPGMLSLPPALRWAFSGQDHTEWDISLCHISVFVHLVADGESVALKSAWSATHSGRAP